uniref:Uncharacterized protein n=1 Tax=viral metagenome TaxID=1070528 RepID=A0A2V0RJY9_9ZZZZ
MKAGFRRNQEIRKAAEDQPRLTFDERENQDRKANEFSATFQSASLQYVLSLVTEKFGINRLEDIIALNAYGRDPDMINKLKTHLINYATKAILSIEHFAILSVKSESDMEDFTVAEGFYKAYDTLRFMNGNKKLHYDSSTIDSLKYFLELSRQNANYKLLIEKQFYEHHLGRGIGKMLIRIPLMSLCAHLLQNGRPENVALEGMLLTKPLDGFRPTTRVENDCTIVECGSSHVRRIMHFCNGRALRPFSGSCVILYALNDGKLIPRFKFINMGSITTTKVGMSGVMDNEFNARTFSCSVATHVIDVSELLKCTDIGISGTDGTSKLFTLHRGSLHQKLGYMMSAKTLTAFINVVITVYKSASDMIMNLGTDAMRLSTTIGTRIMKVYNNNLDKDAPINVTINGPESELLMNNYLSSFAFRKNVIDEFEASLTDPLIGEYINVKEFTPTTLGNKLLNSVMAFVQACAFVNNINRSIKDSRAMIDLFVETIGLNNSANLNEVSFATERMSNLSGVNAWNVVIHILNMNSNTESKIRALASAGLGVGGGQLVNYVIGASRLIGNPIQIRQNVVEVMIKPYVAVFTYCLRNLVFNEGTLYDPGSEEAQNMYCFMSDGEMESVIQYNTQMLINTNTALISYPLHGGTRGVHSKSQKQYLASCGMPFGVDGADLRNFAEIFPAFTSVHTLGSPDKPFHWKSKFSGDDMMITDTREKPYYLRDVVDKHGKVWALFKNTQYVLDHFYQNIADGTEVANATEDDRSEIQSASSSMFKKYKAKTLPELLSKFNNEDGLSLYNILMLTYVPASEFVTEASKVIPDVGKFAALDSIDLPSGGSVQSSDEIKYFSSSLGNGEPERFIIAVRGTKNADDALLDVDLIRSVVDRNRTNYSESPRIKGPAIAYATLKKAFPKSQIIITGHSLGGYIAGGVPLHEGDAAISFNKLSLGSKSGDHEIALRTKGDIPSLPVKRDAITYESEYGIVTLPMTSYKPFLRALNAHSLSSLQKVRFNL